MILNILNLPHVLKRMIVEFWIINTFCVKSLLQVSYFYQQVIWHWNNNPINKSRGLHKWKIFCNMHLHSCFIFQQLNNVWTKWSSTFGKHFSNVEVEIAIQMSHVQIEWTLHGHNWWGQGLTTLFLIWRPKPCVSLRLGGYKCSTTYGPKHTCNLQCPLHNRFFNGPQLVINDGLHH